MEKPWKLIVLLLGIFAAGVVTGGFVTMTFGRGRPPGPQRPRMEMWRDAEMKALVDRVGLTPEQIGQLKPLVKPYVDELTRVRNDSLKETLAIVDKLNVQVAGVLTPEQKTKFDEMTREQRDWMSRIMRNRGGRNRGPGEPPGPPPGKP
ncbi:MAG TPA: hypothetical protein VHD32_04415 [Candidatus Didemnitutus sp.]|nr:hypothetical protein [Candidatus Didemnitutus sp.]